MTSELLRSFCLPQVERSYLPHTLNISQMLPVVSPLAGPSVIDVNLTSFPCSFFNQGKHCLCYPYLSQKSENCTQISGGTRVLQASIPNVYELLSPLTSEVLISGSSIILALSGLVLCTSGGSIAHLWKWINSACSQGPQWACGCREVMDSTHVHSESDPLQCPIHWGVLMVGPQSTI